MKSIKNIIYNFTFLSPSMRREWIEMQKFRWHIVARAVSLHAEGVD